MKPALDTEDKEHIGWCRSGLAACRGGQRRIREWEGLRFCDRCYPHRRRAPGRKRAKKEEKV